MINNPERPQATMDIGEFMLSVDDRKVKPFHCENCGDTYEPCEHWSQEEKYDLEHPEFDFYVDLQYPEEGEW
jgi:hypothetical protein